MRRQRPHSLLGARVKHPKTNSGAPIKVTKKHEDIRVSEPSLEIWESL